MNQITPIIYTKLAAHSRFDPAGEIVCICAVYLPTVITELKAPLHTAYVFGVNAENFDRLETIWLEFFVT